MKNQLRHWITVTESMFDKSTVDAMPDTYYYPTLPGNNPYAIYRFGLNMANHENPDAEGPVSHYAMVVPYSHEEEVIIRPAEKETGHKSVTVKKGDSKESTGVNTISPVAKFTPIKKSR
jgi:hypothetical protein